MLWFRFSFPGAKISSSKARNDSAVRLRLVTPTIAAAFDRGADRASVIGSGSGVDAACSVDFLCVANPVEYIETSDF